MELKCIGNTILKNNEFYALEQVEFDCIGQRYVLVINKYELCYHSRRKALGEFNFKIQKIYVYVSLGAPAIELMLKREMNNEDIIKELEENWSKIYNNILDNYNTEWISVSKHAEEKSEDSYNKQTISDILETIFHYSKEQIIKLTDIGNKCKSGTHNNIKNDEG